VKINFDKLSVQLVETVVKYKRLLIYIKGSPDPDAIAGAYALKLVCEAHGTDATIISPHEPSLPQNNKMIEDLHLPVRFEEIEHCTKHYDAYAVLDHQSVSVEGITGVIPCAFHIDHHEPVNDEIPIDLEIQTREVGSTSTIMIFLVQALGITFDQDHWPNAATALYYGIQTDTDDFLHGMEPDHQALKIITPYADKILLNQISTLPMTKEAMHFFTQALQDQSVYKDWLISGIGFIEEKNRDTMGIIGDFLLKREDIAVAVVFGIVGKDSRLMLDACFRTKKESLNLNTIIKKITREGGARKYKGAFQVNLDYFANCPDRDLLWKTVYATTIETLKKRRDDAAAIGLKKIFSRFKKKVKGMFK